MKADLLSDQRRLKSKSDAAIGETERLIVMLAAGGFLLGAVLALLLGKQISADDRDVQGDARTRQRQFRRRAAGARPSDGLGEMAGAMEEFKMQAIAKAERDAAAQDAQNRASSAARRTELIRFADDFETAVGSIVSNVSASAVQLEQAAGTLTRTAETTQSLSKPGRRRIGISIKQHAIGRRPQRRSFRSLSMKSADGSASPTRSRRLPCFRRSKPTGASANCPTPRKRSATWSS